jgi:putative chitinase
MTLQQRLGVKADGVLGPLTYAAMFRRLGASPANADLFGRGAAAHFAAYGISATPQRLTEWIGEMGHESQSFTRLEENLRYTTHAALKKAWAARFPTPQSAVGYLNNPEALANKVYGGRMGNTAPGDGWRFRGRSMNHTTGRENYRKAGQRLGLPLEARPEMAAEPGIAVEIAAEYWHRKGLNALADQGRSDDITRAINGGTNGLADRRKRKADFRRMWA